MGRWRILVVEDEPDIREILVNLLSEVAEVESAVDGLDALERLQRGPAPSVILLDLRMPRLSGVELLGVLARSPTHPPVVTMSANADTGPPGAAAHLQKPFALSGLVAALYRASFPAPAPGCAGMV
jgi:CheY-like chemotaxis protein